jgi:autotransporter translocation and assembly factor TamB
MQLFKRILAAALVVLGVVLLAIISLYLLVDDASLVSHLVERLESSSDIRVLHRGEARITRTFTPTLTVDGLVVADTGKQYRIETASLDVQISLPKLLLGRLDIAHLWIGDTRVEIKEDESPTKKAVAPEQKPVPKLSPLPLKPLVHDVRVAKLEIIHEDGTLLLQDSHASELTLDVSPANTVELSGQAELAKQNIKIKAILKDVDEYFGGQPLAFSVGVQSTLLHLSLKGQIDFQQPEAIIEVAVRGWIPATKNIERFISGIEIPGTLTLESQLKGTSVQLVAQQMTTT